MSDDKIFLRRALEIAGTGIITGGGPFGAVISKRREDNCRIEQQGCA